MDLLTAITNKIETAERENASYDAQMEELRFKKSVNAGIIEAMRSVLNQNGEGVTSQGDTVKTKPPVYTPTKTVRDTILAFFETKPGEFSTEHLFHVVKAEHPDVSRNAVLNFLAYEKSQGRVDHVGTGLYRFPPQVSASENPNIIDLTEGDAGATTVHGSSSMEATPGDRIGVEGGSD